MTRDEFVMAVLSLVTTAKVDGETVFAADEIDDVAMPVIAEFDRLSLIEEKARGLVRTSGTKPRGETLTQRETVVVAQWWNALLKALEAKS